MSLLRAKVRISQAFSWVDLMLLLGTLVLIYGLVGVATFWTGPYRSAVEIDLGVWSLPKYAFFSLTRGFAAYALSLVFAIGYGYMAAHSRLGERILIPLLDILQSIPVLGFLPGVVLALVGLFPHSNIGLELACVVMIFTGQAWNMTFSFYSSLRGVPGVLRDVAAMYRMRRWEVLRKIEIPFAMNGLLWNSMLSMAGGWFFLMVIESFTLGSQSFRLPGIGSYIALAMEQQDTRAIVAGILVMIFIIVVVDRCLWAPLVAGSQRFKMDPGARSSEPEPLVTRLLESSQIIRYYYRFQANLRKKLESRSLGKVQKLTGTVQEPSLFMKFGKWFVQAVGVLLGVCVLIFGITSLYHLVAGTQMQTWLVQLKGTIYTALRVTLAVILGSLWTIPFGVWIGTHRKLSRQLQPVVQIVASFPAPMVFPIVTYVLVSSGVSFGLVSIILMLLGSQFYILFNVIAGATQIPHQLVDMASVFRIRGIHYWKAVILPCIFPSLVNGWITAAGGAWNASIVSEFVSYGEKVYMANGVGAFITDAAHRADFPTLAAGIVTMVVVIVVINHFFWRKMYDLAETRFRLEG